MDIPHNIIHQIQNNFKKQFKIIQFYKEMRQNSFKNDI